MREGRVSFALDKIFTTNEITLSQFISVLFMLIMVVNQTMHVQLSLREDLEIPF